MNLLSKKKGKKEQKDESFIRSTRLSLLFSNTGKQTSLHSFLEEYKKVVTQFINIMWELPTVKALPDKTITSQITESWLSARAIQAAGKQASGIVRGTKTKQQRRLFVYNKLLKENKLKQARRLKRIIDQTTVTKPDITNVEAELDSRFFTLHTEKNNTTFDYWITLSSTGSREKIQIPLKRTRHINKLLENNFYFTNSIRLSKKTVSLSLRSKKIINNNTKIIGIDIGVNSIFSVSDNRQIVEDNQGWTFSKILDKISIKKRGSKAFGRAIAHRNNFINRSVNQLNLEECKVLRLEDIKDLRKGRISSRKLNHFTYRSIFDSLELECERLGVQVIRTSPMYTSQRCSECGWVQKSNRKGSEFRCSVCGFSANADLNAARNIGFELPVLPPELLRIKPNRTGFYWILVNGEEPIVPPDLKGHYLS